MKVSINITKVQVLACPPLLANMPECSAEHSPKSSFEHAVPNQSSIREGSTLLANTPNIRAY